MSTQQPITTERLRAMGAAIEPDVGKNDELAPDALMGE